MFGVLGSPQGMGKIEGFLGKQFSWKSSSATFSHETLGFCSSGDATEVKKANIKGCKYRITESIGSFLIGKAQACGVFVAEMAWKARLSFFPSSNFPKYNQLIVKDALGNHFP